VIFVRLVDVDHAIWSQFRAAADGAGLTAARALGWLVELEVDRER
jgi:hypothetical protein